MRIDLNDINNILIKQQRNFINIKSLDDDNEKNIYYILSYKKITKTQEKKNLPYIRKVLKNYVNILNERNNKKLTLYDVKEDIWYEIWKSFILDYLNTSWEWYKAGESLIKYIITRTPSGVFNVDMKFINEILNENDFMFIIFFLDKLKISFNFWMFKEMLKKLKERNDINLVINFFSLPVEEINKYFLKNKIWRFEPNKEWFDLFQKSLKEKSFRDRISNWEITIDILLDFIYHYWISLCFEPYPILKVNNENLFTKNEIMKSNKTDDKINKTFSNDIFHLALSDKPYFYNIAK